MTTMRTLHCPACGRSVDWLVPDAPLHGESQATLPDGEPVCAESRACPDRACPVTGFSARVMRLRLSDALEAGVLERDEHALHADFLESGLGATAPSDTGGAATVPRPVIPES